MRLLVQIGGRVSALLLALLAMAGCGKSNSQGGFNGHWQWVGTHSYVGASYAQTITPAPEKQTWLNLNRDSSYSITENGQTRVMGGYHMIRSSMNYTDSTGQQFAQYRFSLTNGPVVVDNLEIPNDYLISANNNTLLLTLGLTPGGSTNIYFRRP